ncbi:DUF1275 family protein [Aureimonas endophytica]|uniref:DUF1275 family protein n=1 Tax=Aureimonas endophytica TaxID=2027858 RepID=A0A916ZTF8_9HYPH|nr:YoaK family protein [Aureimonas endophytica]GGE13385.1 DUF1275 family protein [Aureimonas endophytica]
MSRFSRRAAIKRRRLVVGCLFAVSLSFISGMTDAVGFLTAGDFVSFMSGNTTRLSIALAEDRTGAALRLAGILLMFVVGNAAGVVLNRFAGRRQLVVLLAVALFSAFGIFAALDPAAILSVAFAMGLINVALEEVSGHPLGVSYVTGALSRFGRGLGRLLTGQHHPGWWLQIIPWIGLFSGTVCGAFLEAGLGRLAFLASAGAAMALGFVSLAIPPRWREGFLIRRPVPRTVGRRGARRPDELKPGADGLASPG